MCATAPAAPPHKSFAGMFNTRLSVQRNEIYHYYIYIYYLSLIIFFFIFAHCCNFFKSDWQIFFLKRKLKLNRSDKRNKKKTKNKKFLFFNLEKV